jgi:hypothetical protein
MSKWRGGGVAQCLLVLLVLFGVAWAFGTPTNLSPELEVAFDETAQLSYDIEQLEIAIALSVSEAKGVVLQSAATSAVNPVARDLRQASVQLMTVRFELENARCAHRWDQTELFQRHLRRAKTAYQESHQSYLQALAAWHRKRGAELDFKLPRQFA